MSIQFVKFNMDFIRSDGYTRIKPSTLKVYSYLKGYVIRNIKSVHYRKGKLSCRLSRARIREGTGLSLRQINQAFRQLSIAGVEIIKTGRANYFVLGEWYNQKKGNVHKYVENYYLEDHK